MSNYLQTPVYRIGQSLNSWWPSDYSAKRSIETGITSLSLQHGERLTWEQIREYLDHLEEYISIFRQRVQEEQEYVVEQVRRESIGRYYGK